MGIHCQVLDFPVAQTVKRLPTVRENQVQFLGWEDPLEKGMATHSSILAWEIPGQMSLVGYSPWSQKESDMTKRLPFPSLLSSLIHTYVLFL